MSACARRFEDFAEVIASLFHVQGYDLCSHAKSYISSLLSRVPRKNIERFAEEFGGIDYQNLQQFISDSPWECGPVWKYIAGKAGTLLQGPAPRMLLIDESSFPKRGDRSAGVARQYCGRLGKTLVIDVDNTQKVWPVKPKGTKRPAGGGESGACEVSSIWKRNRGKAVRIELRKAENGTVSVDFWATRVWIWPKACEIPLEVWLLVAQRTNGEMKYSLCNAAKETAMTELATRQGQRHFVERVFEEAKSELGMGEYQVRKWRGWHHHMALVGMAMAFAFEERLRLEPGNPLISTRDVVDMVAWYFQEERSAADVEASIQAQHRRRKLTMESKFRREASQRTL